MYGITHRGKGLRDLNRNRNRTTFHMSLVASKTVATAAAVIAQHFAITRCRNCFYFSLLLYSTPYSYCFVCCYRRSSHTARQNLKENNVFTVPLFKRVFHTDARAARTWWKRAISTVCYIHIIQLQFYSHQL